jgi:hypothetical protein
MFLLFHLHALALSTPLTGDHGASTTHRVIKATDCEDLHYELTDTTLSITGEGSITSRCLGPYRDTTFTSVIVESGVRTVSDAAFQRFTALETIQFPETLREIGVAAFQYCANLTKITGARGLRSIGANAFMSCFALTTFELADTVEIIETGAFTGDRLLQLSKLPDSLRAIEQSILLGCNSITELTIGSRVSSITSAVWQPHSLRRITVVEANEDYSSDNGALYTTDGSTLLLVPLGYPGPVFTVAGHGVILGEYALNAMVQFTYVSMPHVVLIENNVFTSCTALAEVDFGDSLALVQSEAFRDCSALIFTELPDSVLQLNDYAFRSADRVTTVRFGKSLLSVHGRAFSPSLTTISISPDNQYFVVQNDILYSKDLTRLVLYPHGVDPHQVVVPESVRVVADFVFWHCDDLEHLFIPSVVDIGEQSFAWCQRLIDIAFESSLATISAGAFEDDSALIAINFPPSLTLIEESAFYQCRALTTLVIPGTIDEVADTAFSYCTGLETVVIEEGITAIQPRGFLGSGKLASVILPNTLQTIGQSAFLYVNALTYIWIPPGVKTIGASALPSTLLNLSIPGSVNISGVGFPTSLVEIHLRDKPGQPVCDALAARTVNIFVWDSSGLSPGDTVCNGKNITVEPAVALPSVRPSRSKLPRQTPGVTRSPMVTRSAVPLPRPPTPDGSGGKKVPVAAILVPTVVVIVLVFVAVGIVFWRKRRYAKLELESMQEPLQPYSDGTQSGAARP